MSSPWGDCRACKEPIDKGVRVKRGLHERCYKKATKTGKLYLYPPKVADARRIASEMETYVRILRNEGASPKQVCARMGIPYNTMQGRLRKIGLGMDGFPLRPYWGLREDALNQYLEMVSRGFTGSVPAAAKVIGVSERTLQRALKDGVSKREEESPYDW